MKITRAKILYWALLLMQLVPGTIQAAFVDNHDGTVTDTITGLIWDQCSWGQTWLSGPACSGTASTHNWQKSLGIAVTANKQNWRGYHDWRIPNMAELESLLDLTNGSPAINLVVFPNTPASHYWTSTLAKSPDSNLAYVVLFMHGYTFWDYHSASNGVRLVRSGESFSTFHPAVVTARITAINKIYDGTISAIANTSCILSGAIVGDIVTCSAFAANFSDANVGTGKTVTATGITLGGSDAGKYTLIGGAGTCSVTATMAGNANYEPITSSVLDVPVVGGVLTGLAAQGHVGTNNQVQFGAFTISGESRKVLIRGLGPALDGYVPNAIRDPKIALSLNGAFIPLEVNDDWADAENAEEIIALKHQPKNPTESVILRTLEPGIYNVHLSGSGGSTGIGMFQVYAVEGGGNGELKGLAAQGQVGTGNQVQFGALTISGGPRKVLIRGLGPALDGYIPGAIRDPKIALSLNGAFIPLEVNDDWADADNAAEIMALKHQPKNPTESAILRTLEPGIYNVHLSGSGGTEGIGMFQVYTIQ